MMTLEKYMQSVSTEDTREWVIKRKRDWMSDDQFLCFLMLGALFRGFHHIPTEPKEHGSGIEINFRPHSLATFDFDQLTRLVLLSHDWGVRADIGGSGPAMIKLVLHKRHKRDGSMCERHPTIEQAINAFRGVKDGE